MDAWWRGGVVEQTERPPSLSLNTTAVRAPWGRRALGRRSRKTSCRDGVSSCAPWAGRHSAGAATEHLTGTEFRAVLPGQGRARHGPRGRQQHLIMQDFQADLLTAIKSRSAIPCGRGARWLQLRIKSGTRGCFQI